MQKPIIYQIDSFTRQKFKGNPAGVVRHAEQLNEHEMQDIARELNNSETAFILASTNADYDYHIRYFTPTTEVPICGHATIAALYAVALEDELSTCTLHIKTQIGILPIFVEKIDDDYEITMTQGKFELSPELSLENQARLLQGLGLDIADLADNCPIQIASTGHSKVMIGIKSRKKLNQLQPSAEALTVLSEVINCNGYFVFTLDTDQAAVFSYGRMFAPAIGITEDPVTGNAHGPLGGYLVQHGLIPITGDTVKFIGRQGEAIHRLGEVHVTVNLENGIPSRVQIKGQAVAIFRTSLLS